MFLLQKMVGHGGQLGTSYGGELVNKLEQMKT